MSLQSPKPSAPAPPAAQTEEEKRAERLAKLEAWKQKQAAERERKQRELAATGGARSILDEIDRKSGLKPAAVFLQTPVANIEGATPISYAGKFDPKAIAKNATASTAAAPSVLGTDVAVPHTVKTSATFSSTNTGIQANKPPASTSVSSGKLIHVFRDYLY